jgi:TRAP-type C4-dicarboxylate transport system substrate-binding protein
MKRIQAVGIAATLAAILTSSAALAQSADQLKPGQFTWNYADIEPADTLRTRNVAWWLSELEKRSNGGIKVRAYWAGAMVGGKDIPVGVAKGYPEMGSNVYVYDMSFIRALSLFDLPVSKTSVGAIRAFNDMVLNNDIIKAELKKRKLVALTVFGHHGDSMAMTAKEVNGPADLKGLRMRSPGGLRARIMQALGAEVVTMGPADVYTALQRGTIHGLTSSIKDIDEWKWTDYGKHVWSLGIPLGPPLVYVINEDVWNTVPAATQKMILATSAEFLERQIKDYEDSMSEIRARMTAKNAVLREAIPSIAAIVKQVSEKDVENWVADVEKVGLPGKVLLETYRETLKKYE